MSAEPIACHMVPAAPLFAAGNVGPAVGRYGVVGGKQIQLLCFLLLVSGRALVRGPSSLMKKVELSEDQAPDAAMEESSTSLAPTTLYLTTFKAAPATEESLILPVTSLWPQVRGPGRPRRWKGP